MDNRWYTFAEVCRDEFMQCSFKSELIAQCGGNEDIAWAVFFHLREDSLEWLKREVPALEHRVPVALIHGGDSDLVRDCLWSMPC